MNSMLSILWLLAGWSSPPETLQSFREKIYESYVLDNIPAWEQQLGLLETFVETESTVAGRYELLLAQYGLLGFYNASGKHEAAKKLLRKAEKNLDELLKAAPQMASALAIKGSLYGLETELYPAKTIYLGPQCISYLDKAAELGPESPVVWVEKGNMAFHAPAMFGGDKAKAITYFQKAVSLFEQQPANRRHNWLYLHALSWLGQAYVAEDELAKAQQTYEKLKRYEPRFRYLYNVLLPQLKEKQ